jgi:hypothetical protein
MTPISLQGELKSADVWLSESGVGTVIVISGIQVPEALQTRAFYEAGISISTGDGTFEFATDVVIEPAQTNAVGQWRERSIAFSTSIVMAPRALGGAGIRLTIKPEKKSASDELARYRSVLGEKERG